MLSLFKVSASLIKQFPLLTLLALIALVTLVFWRFPHLDIAATGLFYDADFHRRFPALEMSLLVGIRESLILLLKIAVPLLLVALIVRMLARKTSQRLPMAKLLYPITALIVGPGLVTNLLFKENWGRARPRYIEEFGGEAIFSLPWEISDQCAGNCSFVSGETSGAIWLLTLIPLFPLIWQKRAFWFVALFTAIVSLLRIAFGAHFLSDVLLSVLINLFVFAVLRDVFFKRPAFYGAEWLPQRWVSETMMAPRTGVFAQKAHAVEAKLKGRNNK